MARYPAPVKKRRISDRQFTAFWAGMAFGSCALCCKVLGFSPVEQAWAALTLIVMIRELGRV